MKSPQNGTIGRDENEVGLIGRLKFCRCLEFFFVVVNDQEVVLTGFGNAGFDTVDSHPANEARCVREDGNRVRRDEILRNVLCPVAGLFTGSVAETNNEQRRSPMSGSRHCEMPSGEGFAFQVGKLRCPRERGYCENQCPGC
jgi:hypothetical protein